MLLKQLMFQKMEDGDDIHDHVTKFLDIVNKLEDMEVIINGDLLAIMLLYSLPSSYENFRCAIESRDELPTAEVLKIKIIEESEARKQMTGSTVVAMSAEDRGKTRSNSGKKEFKCYKYNLPGHKANVCPDFKCFKCGALGHKVNTCNDRRFSDTKKLKETANSVDDS